MFNKGSRVMVIANGPNIAKGTIGTIEHIDDKSQHALIRYGFDQSKKESIFTGVPLSLLNQVSQNDLSGIDYKLLVDHIYHIGQRWRSIQGFSFGDNSEAQVITIESIQLAPNSKEDLFTVQVINQNRTEYHQINRSVIDDYFILYNPFLEESLGEEILDDGEHFELNPGLRVFIKDTKEVAVLMEVEDSVRAVRLKRYNEYGKEQFMDTTIENIRPATQAEIDSIPYERIVDKIFRVRYRFKAKNEVQHLVDLGRFISPNAICELIKVDFVGPHVLDDRFVVGIGNDWFALSTYYLYTYFIPLNENNTLEVNTDQTKDITIDNFRFSISPDGNIINKADIRIKEIDSYVQALLKLKQILLT